MPKTHRFAMKVASVACGVFDGMADGVTEVEQSSETEFLEFILGDDLRLDLLVSCDQSRQDRRQSPAADRQASRHLE